MRLVIFIATLLLASNSLSAAENSHAKTTADIFKAAKNSVVLIITYDRLGVPSKLGTGFFIQKNTIASNYHVVDGASSIKVKLLRDGSMVTATRIEGYSKNLDLALIEVPVSGSPLKIPAKPYVQVGEKVVAIGNPRGLSETVSEGIISALLMLVISISIRLQPLFHQGAAEDHSSTKEAKS